MSRWASGNAVGERLAGSGRCETDHVASDRERDDRPRLDRRGVLEAERPSIPFTTTRRSADPRNARTPAAGRRQDVLDGFSDDGSGVVIRGEPTRVRFVRAWTASSVPSGGSGLGSTVGLKTPPGRADARVTAERRPMEGWAILGGFFRPIRSPAWRLDQRTPRGTSRLGLFVTRTIGRWIPDPFLLAIGLTAADRRARPRASRHVRRSRSRAVEGHAAARRLVGQGRHLEAARLRDADGAGPGDRLRPRRVRRCAGASMRSPSSRDRPRRPRRWSPSSPC